MMVEKPFKTEKISPGYSKMFWMFYSRTKVEYISGTHMSSAL